MRPLLLCLWIALVAPLFPGNALGQGNDPNAAAQAFRAGVAAAQAGRWQEALDAFDLSYRLRPHPNTLLNLAGAQAQTGKLVEAVGTYRRFMKEVPVSDDNAAMRGAAETYATKLEARVAHLSLTIENGEKDDLLRLDGAPGVAAVPHSEMQLNPGKHLLQVERNGRAVVVREINLSEAAHERLTVSAALVPSAADIAAAESLRPRTPPPENDSVLETWWFWTAVGVVVVAAAVITVFALSKDGSPVDDGNLGMVKVPLR